MPLYEYHCSCGAKLDVRRFSENRNMPVKCEHCGGLMHRVMSVPMAVMWKGRWHDQWNKSDPLGPLGE